MASTSPTVGRQTRSSPRCTVNKEDAPADPDQHQCQWAPRHLNPEGLAILLAFSKEHGLYPTTSQVDALLKQVQDAGNGYYQRDTVRNWFKWQRRKARSAGIEVTEPPRARKKPQSVVEKGPTCNEINEQGEEILANFQNEHGLNPSAEELIQLLGEITSVGSQGYTLKTLHSWFLVRRMNKRRMESGVKFVNSEGTRIMSRWMDEHGMNPSVAERKEICKLVQAAGNDHYTPKSVLHWFKNQRARGPRKASAPASSVSHTTNRETTGSPTISSTGHSQPVDNGGDGRELAEELGDSQISELQLLLQATPNPTDEIIAIWARLFGVEKGAIEAHMQSNRMDGDVDSDGLAEIEPVGGLPTPAASPTAEPLTPSSPCTFLAASEESLPPTSISPLPGASISPKDLSNESDFNDAPPPPIPPAISAESVLKVETGLVLQALVDGVREAAASSSAVHAPAPRSLEDFDRLWNAFQPTLENLAFALSNQLC